MKNKNALAFFAASAKNDSSNISVKFNNKNDHTDLDAAFVMRYTTPDMSLCDLGTGPGLIVNRIYDSVKKIVAVEPFKEYTDKIIRSGNIKIVNKTIADFETDELFDIVTFFATAHYFNEKEIWQVYRKCFNFLKPSGTLIVKNQFGIYEDVVIDGFSEEINANYFAEYRHLPKEMSILSTIGFTDINVIDIYPPESNRWKNTHFYAIVCCRP